MPPFDFVFHYIIISIADNGLELSEMLEHLASFFPMSDVKPELFRLTHSEVHLRANQSYEEQKVVEFKCSA
ncbi:hypothetical protein DV515_00000397, partial [Chloebia gouldiae]